MEIDLVPLAVGAVLLLAGWILYFCSLWVTGGLLGGSLGLLIAEAIGNNTDMTDSSALLLKAGLAAFGALLGIVIARSLAKTAVFILGVLVGGAVFFSAATAYYAGGSDQGDLVISFGTPAAALAMGILCVAFEKLLIALGTSLVGAFLVMEGVNERWGLWPILPLALLGTGVQLGIARGRKSRKIEKSKEAED
ncbi:hypothetical protein BH09SUM1_BH09SUM1_25000 [soil metagenome]